MNSNSQREVVLASVIERHSVLPDILAFVIDGVVCGAAGSPFRLLRPETQPRLPCLPSDFFNVPRSGGVLLGCWCCTLVRVGTVCRARAVRCTGGSSPLQALLHPRPVFRAQVLGNFAASPAPLYFVSRKRNTRPRLAIDASRRERAVLDTRLDVRLTQGAVRERRPSLTQCEEFVTAARELSSEPFTAAHVQPGFRAQTCRGDLASGREQVTMKVAGVAAWARVVDRQIDRNIVAVGQFSRERPCQLQTLWRRQLGGKRDLILTRDSSIALSLGPFRGVPQSCPVA